MAYNGLQWPTMAYMQIMVLHRTCLYLSNNHVFTQADISAYLGWNRLLYNSKQSMSCILKISQPHSFSAMENVHLNIK